MKSIKPERVKLLLSCLCSHRQPLVAINTDSFSVRQLLVSPIIFSKDHRGRKTGAAGCSALLRHRKRVRHGSLLDCWGSLRRAVCDYRAQITTIIMT